MNSRLTEELGAAKKEIEFLKERLRELEVCMLTQLTTLRLPLQIN